MFEHGRGGMASPESPVAPVPDPAPPAPAVLPAPAAMTARPAGPVLDTATLAGWVAALARVDRGVSDAERIEQIRALEALKAAAAAAQAVTTVDFAASQRAAQQAAGVPARKLGHGVGAQVALARRESPARGSRLLGLAHALVTEMPATMGALRAGTTSEWRATILARETACLTREDRERVDAELGPSLPSLGDRQVEAAARRVAYRLDPYAFTARGKKAAADRGVSLRPAPDTMSRLSGFLPVAQGVATYAALIRQADSLRAAGDPRSRRQIMADTLVERVTGQATAQASPVEVHLLITDTALFGDPPQPESDGRYAEQDGPYETDAESAESAEPDAPDVPDVADDDPDVPDVPHDDPYDVRDPERDKRAGRYDEPAHLIGYGPIPAPAARELIERAQAQVWLRRVLTRPGTGQLVAMESRHRLFPEGLRRFLVTRDQVCRTPWCDAPIRHADHVVPAEAGGATSEPNGQGLCEACNHAKQAPHWQARPGPGGAGHTVQITTPTGHTYTSHPPPPPGAPPPRHPCGPDPVVRPQPDAGAPARTPSSAPRPNAPPERAARTRRLNAPPERPARRRRPSARGQARRLHRRGPAARKMCHGRNVMVAPPNPLERPVGRLLRLAQVADPQQVVETLSMTVAELGGSDVVLFMVDYDQSRLRPHPDVLPHGERPEVASLDGSMAGRVFTSGQPLSVHRDDGWHVWVPVVERAQKLGVLSMTLPSWNDQMEDFCVELGIAAAHLVATASGYTDRLHLLRRRKDMSLAAEMQWGSLPPLTFSIDGTTVAGLLEPAYEVGGDSFDYSLNGDILDFVMFDAMGHGLRSATLGALAVSAYRNSRRARRPADVRRLLREVDAVVSEYADGAEFVTGVFARLDIRTGRLRWATAGHPAPLHVRRARTLASVEVRPATPLGLNAWAGTVESFDVADVSLEPGDALLIYTDGVIDARNSGGEEFGVARLRDLLEQESSSGREPAEMLRRLVHSVLTHHGSRLRDDASALYLRWDAAAEPRR